MNQLPIDFSRRQPTSAMAYRDIQPELGQRQKAVYDCLAQYGPMSNMDIARRMGKPINTITPRVYELREKGMVKNCGTDKCKVTGKTVILWGVV